MVDLDAYDRETIQKALWLQRKIKREGTPAVRFMAVAESMIESTGPDIVRAHINAKFRSKL